MLKVERIELDRRAMKSFMKEEAIYDDLENRTKRMQSALRKTGKPVRTERTNALDGRAALDIIVEDLQPADWKNFVIYNAMKDFKGRNSKKKGG